MNAVALAFKEASIAVPPLNKRIWLWLKDHPHKTAAELGVVFSGDNSLSGAMYDLYVRNMATRMSVPNGRSSRGPRTCFAYSALGKSFELLPVKRLPTLNAKHQAAKPPVITLVPVPAPAPVERVKPTGEISIDTLTIKQARALYDELRVIFGDVK